MSLPGNKTEPTRRPRLYRQLSLRLWWAVVAAIAVVTLLLGGLWRMHWAHERAQREQEWAQRPGREVVVRDAHGQELGRAVLRPQRGPQGLEFQVPLDDGRSLSVSLPRPPRPQQGVRPDPFGPLQSLGAFVAVLLALVVAVALAAYPIVRRLTQRLEALQQGVARWGEGQLDTRLPVQGGDEVAFLAERFNAAADRVQALLLAHKALLAHASHELRSPLARIRMALAVLGPGGGADSSASAAGATAAQRREIERSIDELDALIDEILLASRLDLSDPNDATALGPAEEVDLLGLVAEECARTGAQLDVAPDVLPALLTGHAKLLRRLVRNLLENARRHGRGAGHDGGVVLTLARGQPTEAGAVLGWVLAVSDRGPGVPDAWKERIFEPFFRLPGASERDGGVGLGLALVQTIARRHGGQVRCEDRPGGGARFVVFLPKN